MVIPPVVSLVVLALVLAVLLPVALAVVLAVAMRRLGLRIPVLAPIGKTSRWRLLLVKPTKLLRLLFVRFCGGW